MQEVSSRFVGLGVANLLSQCCTCQAAPSPLVQTCCKYISTLMSEPNGRGMLALGGVTRACQLLVFILDRAIGDGDSVGKGADIPLAELAVRGLSRTAMGDGRQAVLDAKGVRLLVEVVRVDNSALGVVEASR